MLRIIQVKMELHPVTARLINFALHLFTFLFAL